MKPMENAKSTSYFGTAFGREGSSPFSCTAVILVIVYCLLFVYCLFYSIYCLNGEAWRKVRVAD